MVFHTYRVTHYPKNENGSYSTSGQDVSEVLSLSVDFELGDAADGFSVTLDNVRSSLFKEFAIDDRLIIEGSLDGTNYTKLLDGIVNSKESSADTQSDVITLSGLNRLEKLFNAVVSTGGGAASRTADEWIKNIIDQVNDFNKFGGTNREITYDSSSIQSIPSSESIRFDRSYEKAFKLIEELSQPENTGGKFMVYYLDADNKFHWKERPQNVDTSLSWGDEIITHRTEKAMFEVVNYVIMNGGKSPYGATILEFDYDVDSINKFGWKVKVKSEEGLASGLKQQDRASKPNQWSDDSEFPNSYPYTTVWGDSVSSNDEYNSSFVDEVRNLLQTKISEFLLNNGGSTFESEMDTTPSLSDQEGDLYGLTIPRIGWSSPENSRVEKVSLSFGTQGWRTSLSFAEDNELGRSGLQ